MPSEFQPLADALYRERVLRARRTPPGERLLDGPRLFAGVCDRMRIGIRLRRPHFSGAQIEGELRRQLERLSRLHQVAPVAAEV